MASFKNTLKLIAQSAIAGLALAFVVVSFRPDLIGRGRAAAPGTNSYAEAVAAASSAVANVFTERVDPGRGASEAAVVALGSAVVIDPNGYLITNYHVVENAAQIRVQLADGRVAVPAVVGSDPDTELALLRIDLEDLPSIRLGRSDTLKVGDIVLAIGNSLGLSQTVTMGIVSATGRGQLGVTTYEDFIQTDAAINAGNSGGALINAAGELIGINTAVVGSSGRSPTPPESIGFAIPVNLVRGVMAELIEHGRVIRGYLGVELQDLPAAAVAPLGVEGGAPMIRALLSADGPAAEAGLRAGDILTHVAGERVFTRRQAQSRIAASAPGTSVSIRSVRTDGTVIETVAVLEDRAFALDEIGS
jgi:S1-C subfamily serine protease